MNNEYSFNAFVSTATDLNAFPEPAPVQQEASLTVDSVEACEILGITPNYLRQFVFKKAITPTGRVKHRSIFLRSDVEALAARRGKVVS